MATNAKNKKEEARAALLRHLGLPKATRAIVVSYIRDPQIGAFFELACAAIGVVFLQEKNELALSGADIWITDTIDGDIPLDILIQNTLIPVIPYSEKHTSTFSEFDPMKFEGNSFIFSSVNQFMMFASLIRAMENMRYSGDKRMLLQNIQLTQV